MSIISLKNVTKKYGDFVAVDNISLKVEAGEVFAFLGPNGAGKTTTIKMMTTLTRPTSGRILLAGQDVTADPNAARRTFGIVFQDQSLDNELTAFENMQFHAMLYGQARAVYEPRIKNLLDLVELGPRQHDFVKTFSGGMRRRLEIVRGLLHQPKILFLDEPTLGLDPQTRNHIWQHIYNLNKNEGVTIFFTTHHMEEVERAAGRVAIIDNGQIITTGTVKEIKAQAGAESLEDAFIKLTGHELRAEANDIGRRRGRELMRMAKL